MGGTHLSIRVDKKREKLVSEMKNAAQGKGILPTSLKNLQVAAGKSGGGAPPSPTSRSEFQPRTSHGSTAMLEHLRYTAGGVAGAPSSSALPRSSASGAAAYATTAAAAGASAGAASSGGGGVPPEHMHALHDGPAPPHRHHHHHHHQEHHRHQQHHPPSGPGAFMVQHPHAAPAPTGTFLHPTAAGAPGAATAATHQILPMSSLEYAALLRQYPNATILGTIPPQSAGAASTKVAASPYAAYLPAPASAHPHHQHHQHQHLGSAGGTPMHSPYHHPFIPRTSIDPYHHHAGQAPPRGAGERPPRRQQEHGEERHVHHHSRDDVTAVERTSVTSRRRYASRGPSSSSHSAPMPPSSVVHHHGRYHRGHHDRERHSSKSKRHSHPRHDQQGGRRIADHDNDQEHSSSSTEDDDDDADDAAEDGSSNTNSDHDDDGDDDVDDSASQVQSSSSAMIVNESHQSEGTEGRRETATADVVSSSGVVQPAMNMAATAKAAGTAQQTNHQRASRHSEHEITRRKENGSDDDSNSKSKSKSNRGADADHDTTNENDDDDAQGGEEATSQKAAAASATLRSNGVEYIFQPRSNDVLSGRSRHAVEHIGNIRFSDWLERNYKFYNSEHKRDKQAMVLQLFKEWKHGQTPQGRFLERPSSFDNDTPIDAWIQISDEKAISRLSQRLRDMKPQEAGRDRHVAAASPTTASATTAGDSMGEEAEQRNSSSAKAKAAADHASSTMAVEGSNSSATGGEKKTMQRELGAASDVKSKKETPEAKKGDKHDPAHQLAESLLSLRRKVSPSSSEHSDDSRSKEDDCGDSSYSQTIVDMTESHGAKLSQAKMAGRGAQHKTIPEKKRPPHDDADATADAIDAEGEKSNGAGDDVAPSKEAEQDPDKELQKIADNAASGYTKKRVGRKPVALQNLGLQRLQKKRLSLSSPSHQHAKQIPIAKPRIHDVLCGRGNGVNKHIGNIRFRRMLEEKQHLYKQATITNKPVVASNLVWKWKQLDPPGRFLKKSSDGSSWVEMDDVQATLKVSKRLRDGLIQAEKDRQLAAEGKLKKKKYRMEAIDPPDLSGETKSKEGPDDRTRRSSAGSQRIDSEREIPRSKRYSPASHDHRIHGAVLHHSAVPSSVAPPPPAAQMYETPYFAAAGGQVVVGNEFELHPHARIQLHPHVPPHGAASSTLPPWTHDDAMLFTSLSQQRHVVLQHLFHSKEFSVERYHCLHEIQHIDAVLQELRARGVTDDVLHAPFQQSEAGHTAVATVPDISRIEHTRLKRSDATAMAPRNQLERRGDPHVGAQSQTVSLKRKTSEDMSEDDEKETPVQQVNEQRESKKEEEVILQKLADNLSQGATDTSPVARSLMTINDVLFADDKAALSHSGNCRFGKVVGNFIESYNGSTRDQRFRIALQIALSWESQQPEGKFLVLDDGTKDVCLRLDLQDAIHKIQQVLDLSGSSQQEMSDAEELATGQESKATSSDSARGASREDVPKQAEADQQEPIDAKGDVDTSDPNGREDTTRMCATEVTDPEEVAGTVTGESQTSPVESSLKRKATEDSLPQEASDDVKDEDCSRNESNAKRPKISIDPESTKPDNASADMEVVAEAEAKLSDASAPAAAATVATGSREKGSTEKNSDALEIAVPKSETDDSVSDRAIEKGNTDSEERKETSGVAKDDVAVPEKKAGDASLLLNLTREGGLSE